MRITRNHGGHRHLATIVRTVAALCAGTALLSACAPFGKSSVNDASSQVMQTKPIIKVNSVEPTKGLLPSNTSDLAGWKIVTQLFEGLVTFGEHGELEYVGAESIEPNADASMYTIKLKPGFTFSDGEPITAQTYADTWSFASNAARGQLGSSLFSTIAGFDALQDPQGDPKAQLSGLKVVDDTTLEVTLKAPDSSFPYKVGDVAFLPIPPAAIADPEKFGQQPVGNGPYVLKEWNHQRNIELAPNPKYQGKRKPANGGVNFVVYQDLDAAYSDLQGGNLDVLDTVPISALQTFRDDPLVTAISKPGPGFSSFTIPQSMKHFQGEEGRLRRAAVMHSIDRESIAKQIFHDTVTPATDFLAPVIAGYSQQVDTEGVLKYDPDKAQQLWKQADAITPYDGEFSIAYAGDGTDREWVEAVVNSLNNTLGIHTKSVIIPTNQELSTAINQRTVGAAFRSGLQSDYPHPEGYLVQGYDSASADGKGLNHGDYKSAEFDGLMREAAKLTDLNQAIEVYQQAERVLLRDLPVIPLWYRNMTAASGKQVSVDFNYMGVPDYPGITRS